MIKAVIFDMDGLLIDSEPYWRRSHKDTLALYGHMITEDDVRASAGKRTADQVTYWQQRFNFTAPSNEELTNQIVDGVIAAIHDNGQPMAGVDVLICELHKHHIPMAVASSSTERLIEVVLGRLGIKDYMQAIHSGENERRGKPFPDVFLSTAQSLRVKPEECLVFEDSLNGVKAAKAAGMRCIAVPELPYDRMAFEAANPDQIIHSLEEINWHSLQEFFR